MKKLYFLFFITLALFGHAQVLTYSATPDSASQSPRTGSTGTFNVSYTGSVVTNQFMYSICCANSKSSNLNLYRFNLNVPASASVVGVSASYTTTGGNGGATNYKWDSLCLTNNFVQLGTYKRDSVNGSGGTFSHGGAADLWGAALTPSIVNSPHFGLRFHLDTWGINTTIVGAFKLTVHYTMPSAIGEQSVAEHKIYSSGKQLFLEDFKETAALEIYSINGGLMKQIEVNQGTSCVDLSELETDIYFYILRQNGKTSSGRLMLY